MDTFCESEQNGTINPQAGDSERRQTHCESGSQETKEEGETTNARRTGRFLRDARDAGLSVFP